MIVQMVDVREPEVELFCNNIATVPQEGDVVVLKKDATMGMWRVAVRIMAFTVGSATQSALLMLEPVNSGIWDGSADALRDLVAKKV